MDVFEALYTTRAMRRVSEDPIPEDILKQMVDAGIRAPSGSNRQGWKFIVVTDQEIKNQLGESGAYTRSADSIIRFLDRQI